MSDYTKDEIHGIFSPLLLDAIVRVLKDEINILRTEAGLSERTNQQVLNAIGAKLDEITPPEE